MSTDGKPDPSRAKAELKRFFSERPLPVVEMNPRNLRNWTRRDFLLLGVGAAAALTAGAILLP